MFKEKFNEILKVARENDHDVLMIKACEINMYKLVYKLLLHINDVYGRFHFSGNMYEITDDMLRGIINDAMLQIYALNIICCKYGIEQVCDRNINDTTTVDLMHEFFHEYEEEIILCHQR